MRLSQDIIFYHLQHAFSVSFVSKRVDNIRFDRPVFYEAENTPPNHVVIISDQTLHYILENSALFKNCLLICPDVIHIPVNDLECSLISFNEQTPPASVFNLFHRIYELFDRWDEALKMIYYEGGNFQDLIDCCDHVIFDPICVVDKQFHYIAYSKLTYDRGLDSLIDTENSVVFDLVSELISDVQFVEFYKSHSVFTYSNSGGTGFAKNIFSQDNFIGRMLIDCDIKSEPVRQYYMSILDHLTYYAERLYGKHLSFSNNEIYINNIRTMIFEGLNRNNVSEEKWNQVTQENHWDKTDHLQIIQLRPNLRYDKNLYTDYLSIELEKIWRGCIVLEFNNRLLLLVNRDKFSSEQGLSLNQTLAYFLRDNLLVAGMSRPFSGIKHMRSAYEQTEVALDFGVKDSPSLWYFKFDDYVLKYMVKCSQGPFEHEMICSEKLLKLRKHDLEKNTDYYNTLLTYFDCQFNAVAAAKKLYIQRSTFLYRMDKIQELVNIDFNVENEVLYLVLSFRLLASM